MLNIRNKYVAKWVKEYDATCERIHDIYAECNSISDEETRGKYWYKTKGERIMLAKKCKHLKAKIKYGNNVWNNRFTNRGWKQNSLRWTLVAEIYSAIKEIEYTLSKVD